MHSWPDVLVRLPEPLRGTLARTILRYLVARMHPEVQVDAPLPEGPVLFVVNHLSNLDGPLLSVVLAAKRPVFVAGQKLQHTPITRLGLSAVSTITIHPSSPDKDALQAAIRILTRDRRSLVLFPEGTRSRTRILQPGKPGVILIAKRARVPLVPVGLMGTEVVMPIDPGEDMSRERFRQGRIRVHIGKPFAWEDLGDGSREEQVGRIMDRIAALLSPDYRTAGQAPEAAAASGKRDGIG